MLIIKFFVYKIFLQYSISLMSCCNLLFWTSGEVHNTGKNVVCTCVLCCFSVIWQGTWDVMFFITVFVYKICLVYWLTLISHFNLVYWISAEVHTTGKTIVCTCLICCFSVIMQSKWDLMLIINIFARYPFLHSSAIFFNTFFSTFHYFQFFHVVLFSPCPFFMFHFFFIAFFSFFIFLILKNIENQQKAAKSPKRHFITTGTNLWKKNIAKIFFQRTKKTCRI